MKYTITGTPKFWFRLNMFQVKQLIKCSKLHYDGVCRAASEKASYVWAGNNGFLTIWLMHAKQRSELSASWHDIDISLKIMENPPPGVDRQTISSLRVAFHGLLREANECHRVWVKKGAL